MIKKIFVWTVACMLSCAAMAGADQPKTTPPGDFKIVAVAGGVASWSPVSKIEIDEKGNGTYSTMSAENRGQGEFKKINEFKIDTIDLKSLYAAVVKADFFSLQENYTKEDVLDGSFAELTVTADGKTHTVRTQNMALKAFDDINTAINIITPKNSKLYYNAIL